MQSDLSLFNFKHRGLERHGSHMTQYPSKVNVGDVEACLLFQTRRNNLPYRMLQQCNNLLI